MPFHFQLITPERVVYQQDVDQVTLPTTLGEITILPHHAPLVATLVPGVGRIRMNGDDVEIALSGGFIEVRADNHVRVLADSAEHGHELNLQIIEAAKTRAEQVMKETVHTDDASFAAAAASLERELARYRVARRHHEHRQIPMADGTDVAGSDNVR